MPYPSLMMSAVVQVMGKVAQLIPVVQGKYFTCMYAHRETLFSCPLASSFFKCVHVYLQWRAKIMRHFHSETHSQLTAYECTAHLLM